MMKPIREIKSVKEAKYWATETWMSFSMTGDILLKAYAQEYYYRYKKLGGKLGQEQILTIR